MNKQVAIITLMLSIPLIFSCVSGKKLPEADKQWLLVPQDFPAVFSGYSPKKGTHGQPYFYKKTRTALSGFSAVYGQQLARAGSPVVSFTSQVSYCRNPNDAKTTVGWYFTIEDRLNKFVVKTDAAKFGTDDVLLIQSDAIFYLAVRKGLVVYFVQIEGVKMDLALVKEKIFEKIEFIQKNPGEFRTDKEKS
jgi:hypothetical protein